MLSHKNDRFSKTRAIRGQPLQIANSEDRFPLQGVFFGRDPVTLTASALKNS
jgi:hypothetical protein